MTRGDFLITLTKISQGDHEAVRTAKNHDTSQRALIEQQAKEIEYLNERDEHFKIEVQWQAKEIARLKGLLRLMSEGANMNREDKP